MDTTDLAGRISQYRELAGLSQGDLAAEIGLDRTAVAKIESGTRKVSAIELSALAQVLKVRLDWFFTDPPAAVVAYRESAPSQTRATIDAWIERLSREVTFVGTLRNQSWPSLHTESAVAQGSAFDPENAAQRVRAHIGNSDTPLRSMSIVAEQLGVLMFSIDFGVDAPDAASSPVTGTGVAIVNGRRDVGRRRLAAAHELGHLLGGGSAYEIDWRIDDAQHGWESDLDRFARALLLPAEPMKRLWSDRGSDDFDERATAIRAASEWQVDMSTLARRLQHLGLLDEVAAGRVRRYRPIGADFVELDLVKRTDLDPTSLPTSYAKSVLRAYRRADISAERAVDLLIDSYSEADLPSLPVLPENAIWSLV